MQMKSKYTGNNYYHDNIATISHIMIYKSKYYLIFATKFSSIFLAEWEKTFVNLQRAKDGTHVFAAKYRYVFVV